jgi:hypothetical protein
MQNVVFTTVRDHSIHIDRANMHCQAIASTRPFDTGLMSAEAQNTRVF